MAFDFFLFVKTSASVDQEINFWAMFLKLGAGIRATHRETAKYQQGPRNWQGAQLLLVGQVWGGGDRSQLVGTQSSSLTWREVSTAASTVTWFPVNLFSFDEEQCEATALYFYITTKKKRMKVTPPRVYWVVWHSFSFNSPKTLPRKYYYLPVTDEEAGLRKVKSVGKNTQVCPHAEHLTHGSWAGAFWCLSLSTCAEQQWWEQTRKAPGQPPEQK